MTPPSATPHNQQGVPFGLTEAITVLSQTLRHSDANFLRGAATKANMMLWIRHVRSSPKSGHGWARPGCPL